MYLDLSLMPIEVSILKSKCFPETRIQMPAFLRQLLNYVILNNVKHLMGYHY